MTLVATCLNSMYASINVTGIAKETRSSCNTTHRISTTFAFQPGTVAVCQQRHSDRGSGGRHLRRHERIPREEPRAARGEQHHEQPRRRPQRPPQAPGPLAGGGGHVGCLTSRMRGPHGSTRLTATGLESSQRPLGGGPARDCPGLPTPEGWWSRGWVQPGCWADPAGA